MSLSSLTSLRESLPKVCLAVALTVAVAGCGRSGSASRDHPHGHSHEPPHGGAVAVLGEELYHVEFVHDAALGALRLYVLDAHMENFVRIDSPPLEADISVGEETQTLVFDPVANRATGETTDDTSLLEAKADWLKDETSFSGVLKSIVVKGTEFNDIAFRFPSEAN